MKGNCRIFPLPRLADKGADLWSEEAEVYASVLHVKGHDSFRNAKGPGGLGHVAARVLERVHNELELDLGEPLLKAAMVPGA